MLGFVRYKLIIIFAIISLGLGIGSHKYLNFEMLFATISTSLVIIEKFKPIIALLYFLGYSIIVMFSIPVASLLTVTSGYLFGSLLGGLVAFSGALVGSSCLFLIVRAGTKLHLEAKLRSNPILSVISAEIYENQFRYLLFLRFFPVFPFWIVNLAPAILGIKFWVVFFTTFIGILPGTFLIAAIGERLRIISKPTIEDVYELTSNPKFLLLFLILSFILIVPTILKIWQKKGVTKTPQN